MTILLQAAVAAPDEYTFGERLLDFVDTPAPYSPFSEYLLFLFVLWLIARIHNRKKKTFSRQAQEVLDQKYSEGELSEKAYRKFREDVSLRPRR